MYTFNEFYKCITYITAQGGVHQDFLHVRAYNIMHTLTYTSDFNCVHPVMAPFHLNLSCAKPG